MTILLTGASGRLGSFLLSKLVDAGYRVIAHGRESSDLRAAESRGCEIRRLDLRSTEKFDKLVKGADCCIHTAALVSFRADKSTMFTGLNTIAPLELFRAARRSGVKRFVHISSIASLGGQKRGGAGQPVREDAPYQTGHLAVPYLQSKHEADRLLRAEAAKGGPELIILMPSIIIGPHLAESSPAQRAVHLQRSVLPRLACLVNVVDLRDVTRGIISAMTAGKSGQSYLLSGTNIPLHQFIARQAAAANRSVMQIPLPLPVLQAAAGLCDWWGRIRNRSERAMYPALVEMLEYDWAYDSSLAADELGFTCRPLDVTLQDHMSSARDKQQP